MLHFSRWKTLTILGICLLGLLLPVPNFFSKERYDALWPVLQHKIGLGLDLRGGAHVLASMNLDELKKDWYAKLTDEARKRMREAKLGYTGLGVAQGGGVQVRLGKPEDMDAALKALRPIAGGQQSLTIGGNTSEIDIRREGNDLILIQPTEVGINARVGQAIGAAVEIVRTRLDPGGVKEVSVQRQGNDRILVQVPGVEDTKDIIEAFNVAKLTFHLLHPSISPETMGARPPPGYEVVPDRDKSGVSYLINSSPLVTGEDLVDSQPGFDNRNGEPMVTFRFNQRGALLFGRVTKENVGRPFAMIIDGKVLSAPRINEPILGGSGQITGSFTLEEANRLATNLRSGALPAKLTVVEERVVGASLGADSIEAGKRAAIIGMLGVAAFMIFAYGLLGVFAVIGAAMHVVLVIAIMSLIGSTMTLPGIAGVVLTIGMAVDANVLIYERIREELRNDKPTISAIDQGFTRAYATIIDSQLTTFIAGLVMFMLGSGPIRGFAVTLTLGILTTVFTAFTITRLLVSWWLGAQKTRKIEAPLSYSPARNKMARP